MNELLKYLLCRIRKNERGVALLELAIITPVLLLLIMGIVEFGWLFNGYITLTGAAREGARVAAVNGDYEKAVDDHINALPRLNVSSISKSGGAEQGDEITVVVGGEITLLVGLLPLPDPFPLNAEATMRRQYLYD